MELCLPFGTTCDFAKKKTVVTIVVYCGTDVGKTNAAADSYFLSPDTETAHSA